MRHENAYRFALAIVIIPLFVACDAASSEEQKMRAGIVGDYVLEMGNSDVSIRQVLTLRADSRWTMVTTMGDILPDTPEAADSGNYRIQGVTLNLHSEVEPSAVPMRYTVSGDTLFDANAALTYAITTHDIGERFMVRER